MNNQIITWSALILPWSTIFLLKKQDLKRFMPATLFTAVTSGIILQIGYAAKLWYFRDASFSVVMYGLLAIASLWVIKFTFEHFIIYTITNAILDLFFAFVIIPWFARRGVFGIGTWSCVYIYSINIVHAMLIYGYQMWQEWNIQIN